MAKKPEAPRQLALIEQARQALEQATTFDEVVGIRDKAEVLRKYCKTAKLGLEAQNKAAELKLRAERKAGAALLLIHLRGGDRKSKSHRVTLKLEDFEITRNQSSAWQLEAKVPETEFERYLKATESLGKELTATGLLRIARRSSGNGDSPKPNKKPKTPPVRPCRVGTEELEIVREMSNHLETLHGVVGTILKRAAAQVEQVEHRTITRLLKELRSFAKDLEKVYGQNGVGQL